MFFSILSAAECVLFSRVVERSSVGCEGARDVHYYLGIRESIFKERWQPRQQSEESACCAKVRHYHGTEERAKRQTISYT